MRSFLKRFTSRKFIASMVGVIAGLAVSFGADGDTIQSVAGVTAALVSAVSFVFVEGKVDAVSAAATITAVTSESTDEAVEESEVQ